MGQAAIYARQSITREGSASLETQVEACRDVAARLKLQVVVELVEAPSTSGYRDRGRSRPKFLELLDLIRSGEVDCVIAYNTDRLSRGGGPGWAPLVDAFEAAGRDPDRVIATTDGWVSEFEIGIRSAMDREESKKTSERMLDVRRREAVSGVPRIAGRRAYGHTRDYSAIVEGEAAMIHEAVERVRAGESMWSISSDWNRRGVATVTGGAWTVQTLTPILRSGRIAGLREHRGAVVAEGQWPSIITPEVRDELLVLLATKRPAGKRARSYPLTGLLVCGRCGHPLRSLAREGGKRSYACRSGPGLGGCGGIRIQAPGVEDHVRDVVRGMVADPDNRAALASIGADAESPGADESPGEVLRKRSEKRQRLIDLYTDGDIDRTEFRARRDVIDDEIGSIEVEIAQRQGTRTLTDIPQSFDELVDEWEHRGIDFQRRLIALLLHPITVQPAGTKRRTFDPGRLEITPKA